MMNVLNDSKQPGRQTDRQRNNQTKRNIQSDLILHPPLSFITTVNETQPSAIFAIDFFLSSWII